MKAQCYDLFMIKTTIRLEEDLFKQARKEAIDKRMAFTTVVAEALKSYLYPAKKVTKHRTKIRTYDLGKVRGNLSRSELYRDV